MEEASTPQASILETKKEPSTSRPSSTSSATSEFFSVPVGDDETALDHEIPAATPAESIVEEKLGENLKEISSDATVEDVNKYQEEAEAPAPTPAAPSQTTSPVLSDLPTFPLVKPETPTPRSPTDELPPTLPPSFPTAPLLVTTNSTTSSVPSTSKIAKVFGVCLVAFDHAIGPCLEWSFPASLRENDELVGRLPFLALPDGAHTREEDYSYFHLFIPSVDDSTIFGISCNRQISSEKLLNKGKDVTRSTVQKAIVVLASKPIFGALRDKLGLITRAFFAQQDFEDKGILMDLYSSLEVPLEIAGEPEGDEDGGMYMGTSLRELVYRFRFRTLMLLKLLLLQRKVMFYAAVAPAESLCTFQYSLVALIPALLTHLDDSGAPELDALSQNITRPSTLKTSDKKSLLRYLGLPLQIFGKGAFFQPYLPLQQIDFLQTDSYLVGTTNSIFQQQRDCQIDVIVNLEAATLEVADPKLASLLTLTAADRKWMDEIVSTVDSSWNTSDPSRPAGMSFVGSDDFIRAKFEEYICSMLASIKFTDFLANAEQGNTIMTGSDVDSNMLSSFNEKFVHAFKETPAFKLWDQTTDSVIFDLVEPKHPMEGKTNPIEDVGIRLAHGLHDLHLEDNLVPTREAITRGIATGSESIWKTYSTIRSDFSKRQTERSEKQRLSSQSGTISPPIDLASPLLAGVDVAKTGAASLATGIGSFLSSKRTQFFAPAAASPAPSSPPVRPRATSPHSFEGSLPPLYPTSASDDEDERLYQLERERTSPSPPIPSTPSFGSFFRPPSISSFTSGASSPRGSGIGMGSPSLLAASASGSGTASPAGFFSAFSRRVSDTLAVVENNVRQYASEPTSTGGGNGSLPTKVEEEEEDARHQEEALEMGKVRDLDKEWEERRQRELESELERQEAEEEMREGEPIEVEKKEQVEQKEGKEKGEVIPLEVVDLDAGPVTGVETEQRQV